MTFVTAHPEKPVLEATALQVSLKFPVDMYSNTVDVENATWTNDIGQAILSGYWEDPEFDPSQAAFYYVRVIEIPTPRWTVYDAKQFGVALPEGVPTAIQDRAYTSPIWYSPN
jgi:hypothetical protein